MLRYCLQPLKKWGSGTAQESPGCCILHLPSLPSGFLLGQTLIFLLPPWRNICLSGSTLTPLNHLGWEIRTSVKVQLVYKRDTGFSKLCSSCGCPEQVTQTIPVPSAQSAQQREWKRAVQGRDSQGKPSPPCHPGQWAPLPAGRKEMVVAGGSKGAFCTCLPCSPQHSLRSTIVLAQPGCRAQALRADNPQGYLLAGR